LSVGAQGLPVISTTQPYGNLKLATGHLRWPIDPNSGILKLVPLVEPVGRLAPSYPSSWPENIDGETPHSAMANEITALVRANLGRDFVSVHSAVGEDGQGMVFLRKNAVKKGLNGRSYEAALVETQAIARLAKGAAKAYGVGAIIVTHGESDAGNPDYEKELRQLWLDYNADLPAITGQKQKIQLIVSQQNSCNDRSPSTLAQWKAGDDFPADIVCSGPKYQYPSAEGVHLTAEGYRQLGEKYGQVYFRRVVLGEDWKPLEPAGVERNGRVLAVRFHVPVPPLAWDASLATPHAGMAEWENGKGFEVNKHDGGKVTIESAAISGDAVLITCASDPGPGARVGYAMIGEKVRMGAPFAGTFRWGLLRDSDPFVGEGTRTSQPNHCVAFEITVP
jgi:lysophospholipase L1-like esterase